MMNYENLQPEHLCGTMPVIVYGSQSKINLKSLPKLQLQANPSTLSPLKIGIAFMQMHGEHNSWNGLRHDVSYDVTGCDLPWRH